MIRPTALLASAALLAVPATADAGKPANPGQHGRDTAAAKQQEHGPRPDAAPTAPAKPKPAKGKGKGHAKGKAVAFTLHGVALTDLRLDADGALAAPLSLDPTAANRHARTLLDLTEDDVDADTTVTFGEPGDAVAVRYVGLTAADALDPSDEVHVTGRVRRATRTAPATLDLTRIVVVRPETAPGED